MRPNNVVCHSSENESWEALQLFSVEVRKIFFFAALPSEREA